MKKWNAYKYSLIGCMVILLIGMTGLTACSNSGVVSKSIATTQNSSTLEQQQLQQLINLTHSPDYDNALVELSQVKDQSNQLATSLEGLPQLPNLLNYATLDDINTAIQKAQYLRSELNSLSPLLSLLPSFPPPPPPVKDAVQKLENMRQDILNMSEPIEQLPDLPLFIPLSDTLPNAKQDIENHFSTVESVADDTTTVLQHLKDLSEKSNGIWGDIKSYANSSEYQTLSDKLNQINGDNNQLITLVGTLPPLPASLSNIPVDKVEKAVKIAGEIYPILKALPPLTLLSVDPNIATLESLRLAAVKVTGILSQLPDLPDFISGSQNLEEVRIRTQTYLGSVQSASSYSNTILQQVNQIVVGQLTTFSTSITSTVQPTQSIVVTTTSQPITTTAASTVMITSTTTGVTTLTSTMPVTTLTSTTPVTTLTSTTPVTTLTSTTPVTSLTSTTPVTSTTTTTLTMSTTTTN